MTPENVNKLRSLLYLALIPTEALNKEVFKSSIRYCVIVDAEGNLVVSDWLNDYPEIKKEIEEKFNQVTDSIQ